MDSGFAFLDIVFFAMLAAFLVLRLRSVLGRRTGNEKEHPGPFRRSEEAGDDQETQEAPEKEDDKVVPMRRRTAERQAVEEQGEAEESVAATLTRLQVADPRFEPNTFLEGAQAAFGMIIDAFARGDRETLRPLLAEDVYGDFESAISQREEADETLETTIHTLQSAEITDAELEGNMARLTVTFVSDQTNVLKDSRGHITEGDPSTTETVTDIWTFARDVTAEDPNWQLVATRSPE